MKRSLIRCGVKAAGLSCLLVGAVLPAAAAKQRSAQASTIVLQPGTVIPVKLNSEITSNRSKRGDTFTATVDQTRPAYRSMMRGGIVYGVVKEATPRRGNNPGILDIAFTRMSLPDGRSVALSGVPTSLNAKYLSTRRNGVVVAKNTRKNERLKYAGIGAGSVALVKVLSGDKVRVTDLLLGGALGYGVGSVVKGPKQVNDVVLKSGTPVGVLLNNGVRYSRLASRASTRRR